MKKFGKDMDRREFLRGLGTTAAALGTGAVILQTGDLMQAATVMAWFVYNAAMREEKLPRKYFDASAPAPGRGGN